MPTLAGQGGNRRERWERDGQVASFLWCPRHRSRRALRQRRTGSGWSTARRMPGIRRVHGCIGALVGTEPAAARTDDPAADALQRGAGGLQDVLLRSVGNRAAGRGAGLTAELDVWS